MDEAAIRKSFEERGAAQVRLALQTGNLPTQQNAIAWDG
jgi:hypothetical protein